MSDTNPSDPVPPTTPEPPAAAQPLASPLIPAQRPAPGQIAERIWRSEMGAEEDAATELGSDPREREPIGGPGSTMDAILRQPRRVMYQLQQTGSGRLIAIMLVLGAVCSLVYGLIVGTFIGGTQLWASPVKVACGLLISILICLPSLYIFTCLSGSQARLREVVGFVAGLMLLIGVLLTGFAPVAWIFSQSTESVACMGFLHLVFWVIAAAFGLRFLHAAFANTRARSNLGLNVWTAIFLVTSFQMMTALRPLIGKADTLLPTEKKFFINHWSDCCNAKTPEKPAH